MERNYAGAHPDYDFHGMLAAVRRKEKKKREAIRKKMEEKAKTKTAKKIKYLENHYFGPCSEKQLEKEGQVNQEQSMKSVQEKEHLDKRSKEQCKRGQDHEILIEEPQLRGRQDLEDPQLSGSQEQVLPLCRRGQVLQWSSSLWGSWGVQAWLHSLPHTVCRFSAYSALHAHFKSKGMVHLTQDLASDDDFWPPE